MFRPWLNEIARRCFSPRRRGRRAERGKPSCPRVETLEIRVVPAALDVWTGTAGDGLWATGGNWSRGAAPINGQNAAIPNGSFTVVHATGSDTIGTLSVGTGDTLQITGGSSIVSASGFTPQITDDGTIDLGDASTAGTLQLNASSTSVSGSGAIVLGASTSNTFGQLGGQTLSIGSGVTVSGQSGTVGNSSGTLNNAGSIQANVSAAGSNQLTLNLGAGTNTGSITVTNGDQLQVYGSWTNQGTIGAINVTGNTQTSLTLGQGTDSWTNSGTVSATSSTVNLGGSITQASLGGTNFSRDAGSTINLTGTLTGNLTLDNTTGSWNLRGGSLKSGTFTANGSAP